MRWSGTRRRAGGSSLSGQTASPRASQFGIGSFRHQTHAESQTSLDVLTTNKIPSKIETFLPPPPTRSSFMATWLGVSRAKGYLLDVSTGSSFDGFVDGYHDLDVGNVTGRAVTGLTAARRITTGFALTMRPHEQAIRKRCDHD